VVTVQIVLAAGRSERMGSPKPLLRFGGRTALALVLDAAAGAGVERSVVVVGEAGAEVIAAHGPDRLPLPVSWVWNREPGAEQLRSLQLALESILRDPGSALSAFFVHPADHPLATVGDYEILLRALEGDGDAHDVFIPSHGGRRGHPILCRARLAASFLALRPDGTARDVIERARIAYALTPNAGVRDDMDTPEDYERLRSAYEGLRNPGTMSRYTS